MRIKASLFLLSGALSAGAFLSGCQSTQPSSPTAIGAARSTRNNCLSLLHQLLEEQKDVSLLRFIKSEHPDVKNLLKRIAHASSVAAKQLEEFAIDDRSISLDDIRLPPGETATRQSIAATKRKELLGQKGDQFELSLLLTQTEALIYASHLARVAAANEPDPDRARSLARLSMEMRGFYQLVFAILRSRAIAPADH